MKGSFHELNDPNAQKMISGFSDQGGHLQLNKVQKRGQFTGGDGEGVYCFHLKVIHVSFDLVDLPDSVPVCQPVCSFK